jgi:hypothetical protein
MSARQTALYSENAELDEEPTKAMSVILGAQVPLMGGERVSLYDLIAVVAVDRRTRTKNISCDHRTRITNINRDEADAILRRCGIRVLHSQGVLAVANSHHELLKLIADTPYASDLAGQLMRLPGAEIGGHLKKDGTKGYQLKFNGTNCRYVTIPLTPLLEHGQPPPRPMAGPIPLPIDAAQHRPAPALLMTDGWEITDHVCLRCIGRILRRVGSDDTVEVRCSNCGLVGAGKPQAICWCGFLMKEGRQTQRFKCHRNENPSPEMPGEIEVMEV